MSYAMTYNEAMRYDPCGAIDRLGRRLGGWDEYGRDTPVSLVDVLDLAGREAARWALEYLDMRSARDLEADDIRMEGHHSSAFTSPWTVLSHRHGLGGTDHFRAHTRMVLAGRIRPGHWRAGKGWQA